jgi:8-oxo-dGTP pyrophosphatase MutT (NUDIX family)
MEPIAQPRVAAGALFFNPDGLVLLVQPTYTSTWEIPGGNVQPGESPLQACRREVREELGIEPPIGGPLVVDWAPADGEGDKLLFVFDGGTLPRSELDRISLAGDEIAEWRLVSPTFLDAHLNDRLSRRVHTALAARERGRTAYAEHGTEARTGTQQT